MEPGDKAENWVLAVRCRRDTVQKVVVFQKHVLESATGEVL